jgi:hypothetical protein
MDDVRARGSVRPNFWADRLTSYAFAVETTIGQNPMRYLLARRFDEPGRFDEAGRFDEHCLTRALTLLFVVKPAVLFGTYVRISEGSGDCEVHTFLPTMAHPRPVAGALVFDCLPLTDVGYVDLMAWPHPWLRAVGVAPWDDDRYAAAGESTPMMTLHYQGPPSLPTLLVCEDVDRTLSMVTRRILYRGGQQVRRWEITERGGAGQETLPRRVRVSRPQTGHETEFVRATPAVALPPEIFDEEPRRLQEWIQERLAGE